MTFIPTHTGVLVGDAQVEGQRPEVQLCETKSYWITQYGMKYRKTNGRAVGWGRWTMRTLDITSVAKI